MRHFIFLVALFAALVIAGKAQKYEPLPGINNGFLGYNIAEDRFALTAVKMTYDMGQKLLSPYDKETYSVPDQIDPNGIRTSSAFAKYDAEVYIKEEQWVQYQGKENGIHMGFPGFFDFSRSSIKRRMESTLKHVEGRYAINGEQHTYYTVTMLPPELLEPSDKLMTMLKRVNYVYNPAVPGNQQTWWNIFQYFGTYYPSFFVLGGEVHAESSVNITRLRNTSSEYIRDQVGFKFGSDSIPGSQEAANPQSPKDPNISVPRDMLIPIDTTGEPMSQEGLKKARLVAKHNKIAKVTNKNNKRDGDGAGSNLPGGITWVGFSYYQVKEKYTKMVDDYFRQSSHTTTSLLGGEQTHMDPEHWRDWVPSLITLPEVVKKTLTPIWRLFDDDRLINHWQVAEKEYQKWWIDNQMYNKSDSDYYNFLEASGISLDPKLFGLEP